MLLSLLLLLLLSLLLLSLLLLLLLLLYCFYYFFCFCHQDESCDVVVPLQHTYVPDDHRTCREFDFPVVLSGHVTLHPFVFSYPSAFFMSLRLLSYPRSFPPPSSSPPPSPPSLILPLPLIAFFPSPSSCQDHHLVDEVVEGTRLLKPGLDAVYATVLDLSWDNAATVGRQPTITASFVKCSDYPPDTILAEGILYKQTLEPPSHRNAK